MSEGELQRDLVVAKSATTATDGKVFNLDYKGNKKCQHR